MSSSCGSPREPTREDGITPQDQRRRQQPIELPAVNVVDLMRLEPDSEHPHGLSDLDFDALFTTVLSHSVALS